jgi:hypothetical protein
VRGIRRILIEQGKGVDIVGSRCVPAPTSFAFAIASAPSLSLIETGQANGLSAAIIAPPQYAIAHFGSLCATSSKAVLPRPQSNE